MGFWRALREHVSDYFRQRAVIYALVVSLLAIGVGVGAVAVDSLSEGDHVELSTFLTHYVRQATTPSERGLPGGEDGGILVGIARGALVPWLLGLTIIGAPLALALVFLRGFAVGFTLKFLFDELSYKGALLGVVSVVPHTLLTLFGICLASGAALTFSIGAAKVLAGRRDGEAVLGQFLTSTLLTLFAAFCVAAGTWIQANVTPVLVDLTTRWIQI